MTIQINEEQFLRDMETLRQFGLQADGAVHRVAYSPIDMEAQQRLKTRLESIGVASRDDTAGNICWSKP